MKATSDDGTTTSFIDSVTSVEGDCDVCQRKGKVICLFDLRLVLSVTGSITDSEGKKTDAKGTITIPEVAYDSEESDYQFDISIFSENNSNSNLRTVTREKLLPLLRKQLGVFGKDLITTHGNDIQHPPTEVKSKFTLSQQVQSTSQSTEAHSQSKSFKSKSDEPSTVLYNTSTLHLEYDFGTSGEELYKTLLEPPRVAAWTRSQPNIQPTEGGSFSLFGGNIEGKINKLVPNEKIDMLWRLRDWKSGHYANLNLSLHQGSSDTKLEVFWKGIPIGQEESTQNNFEEYYVKAIKLTFGYGAVL